MGGKQSRLRSPPFAIPDSPFAHETVRGDPLTNGFQAWWERTADSFVQVAGGSSFAMKGTLNTSLDAGTLTEASIDITFTGDDWDLEEATLEEATTMQPLGGWRMGNGESRMAADVCRLKGIATSIRYSHMAINDHRDIEVWHLGRNLVRNIYELTREFPDSEKFGLVSQLRRASISVPSSIAEGWGRRYTAEFVQFLRKANGSRTEVETQLILSTDLGFLTSESLDTLLRQTTLLGKKVLSLERNLLRRGAPQTGPADAELERYSLGGSGTGWQWACPQFAIPDSPFAYFHMSTIAPVRLFNVTDAASFVALSQQNWVIASEELFRRVPTYQNGSPNTLNGPPTSGTWNVGDFWRDQNGAEFVCTVAGTPGTWRQTAPATVNADPAGGTFPAGYLMLNTSDGGLKRHAGGLSWEVQVGASTSSKVGFHGAAPTARRANANQEEATDLASVITLANELRAALVQKGSIRGEP